MPLTAEDILKRTQGDKFDPNAEVLRSEQKELADRAKGVAFIEPKATPAVPVEQKAKLKPAEVTPEAETAQTKSEEVPTPSPLETEAAVKPIRRR